MIRKVIIIQENTPMIKMLQNIKNRPTFTGRAAKQLLILNLTMNKHTIFTISYNKPQHPHRVISRIARHHTHRLRRVPSDGLVAVS